MMKGRPKKVRYIQHMPRTVTFSPRGKPGRPDEIEIALDQLEALKLADFQGFSQDQGAQVMNISRASFGRILREARRRVADALVNGKIMKIRMGDAQIGVRKKNFSLETFQDELVQFQSRSVKIQRSIRNAASLPEGVFSRRESAEPAVK
jgi:predicted DNA-binding protein (UPF0251 family)